MRVLGARKDFGAGDVELDANGVPTAFRIWKAGPNPTDHGTHVFTDRSAKLLMAEQAERDNLYSIDVDHLSLSAVAPPESRKAAGWLKLAVRGGDLWATDVRWTDFAKAGLAADPPEWRYFSPAYDVEKSTREITSFLNVALTNNPATWSNTALASLSSRQGQDMTLTDILAALLGDDAEKKTEALAALKALASKEADADADADADKGKDKAPKPKPGDDDKDAGKDKKAVRAAEDSPSDSKNKDEDKEEEKAASIAATKELAGQVATLSTQVATLTADKLAAERAQILASRTDLPAALVKTLGRMPLGLMRETIASIPVTVPDPAAADRVMATRGQSQVGDGEAHIRAARLPAADHEDLLERFGKSTRATGTHWRRDPMTGRNNLYFPIPNEAATARVEATRIMARRQGGQTAAAPQVLQGSQGSQVPQLSQLSTMAGVRT